MKSESLRRFEANRLLFSNNQKHFCCIFYRPLLLLLLVIHYNAQCQVLKGDIFIDLDNANNKSVLVLKENNKEIIAINIIVKKEDMNDTLHNKIPLNSSLLIAIYLMPHWKTKKTCLVNKKNNTDVRTSEDWVISKAVASLSDCFKNKSYENRTPNLKYVFRLNGVFFENKGLCLSEFFLVRNFQTLYPNENDFFTINVKSTPFSLEEYDKLYSSLLNTDQGELVIYKNLFGRIFLNNYAETVFPFWVSPEPFHRDFGIEINEKQAHDAHWYEEGNYNFLFREGTGIVGREFNLFFGEKSYLKSQPIIQKSNRINLDKYFENE